GARRCRWRVAGRCGAGARAAGVRGGHLPRHRVAQHRYGDDDPRRGRDRIHLCAGDRMTTDDRRARVERAVQEHAPALLSYFARRAVQREDAADLLAETLLVLWRRSRSLPDADDEIRPWMFGIARNVLMHH